ncbi:hypothetical protein TWF718_007746 [Orbilia javanica]|uniref:Uncharacterized protein n=1 Tax=Orbilia javanica TaxID=47235 RepID=A0AAN8RMH3_9PEZI
MLFSKILVLIGAAVASAATIPTGVLDARAPSKTSPEKRAVTGSFYLQVVGGSLDGKFIAGDHDTTGAFIDVPGDYSPITFSIGTGGLLETSVGDLVVMGWSDLAWVFFDGVGASVTGCSLDGSDYLVGCTATFETHVYDLFGSAESDQVWAMGNSGTVWATYTGQSVALKAIQA